MQLFCSLCRGAGAHVGWQTARRQNGLQLQMAPYSSLAHYDTWVPNDDAASSFYPVAHTHVEGAGMGTNSAFIGSSDGAHTGWSTARGTRTNTYHRDTHSSDTHSSVHVKFFEEVMNT
jgi:hypothetical protein